MPIASQYSIALLFFVLTSCFPIDHVGAHRCADLEGSFFSKPTADQMKQFSSYTLDEQYAIYICGNQAHEPPAIYLAEPFAREGEKVVGLLKGRLSNAHDDLTIRDTIAVFSEMSWRQTYDVAGNGELMNLMTRKVNQMKDADWRRITERKLREIAVSKAKPN